jgi:hypothetical protein
MRKTKTKSGAGKGRAKAGKARWSQEVSEHSDALDLKRDVFKLDDPTPVIPCVMQHVSGASQTRDLAAGCGVCGKIPDRFRYRSSVRDDG